MAARPGLTYTQPVITRVNKQRLSPGADMDRRDFVKRALKGGHLLLAFQLGGAAVMLSPHEAHARQVPLQTLHQQDAALLEQLLDVIVPGALDAGTVHFLDHQLGVAPNDCLLMAKFFEIPLPYSNFYQTGFQVLRDYARAEFSSGIEQLTQTQKHQLIACIATPERVTAAGFPIFVFYLCLRADAVDMVYGTPAGFEKLNVPYMAHIMPPRGWHG